MSQANVEITKRGIDAFNRRDVKALADVVTPDFEWFPALPSTVEGRALLRVPRAGGHRNLLRRRAQHMGGAARARR